MDDWVLLWNINMKGYIDTKGTNAQYPLFQSRMTLTDWILIKAKYLPIICVTPVINDCVCVYVCLCISFSLSVSLLFSKKKFFSWLKVAIWFRKPLVTYWFVKKKKRKEIKQSQRGIRSLKHQEKKMLWCIERDFEIWSGSLCEVGSGNSRCA